MAGDVSLELKAITGEFIAKIKEAGTEVEHLSSKGKSSFDKLATVGKAAFLGIVGAGTAVAGMSLELADTFEKAHARLEGAIHNAGGSYEEFASQIAATQKTMEGFGHTNADTQDALAMLTNATHSTGTALTQMTLAANIAAGRNISLSEATGILMKVDTGHVALLGRLGIATKDASGKTIDQATAVKKLSDMYGGDAARTADTFAGKTLALKTQLEDVGVQIGLALIPILETLASTVSSVIGWLQKHTDVAYALAGVIGGVLSVSIVAWGVDLVRTAALSVKSFATWVAGLFTVTTAEEATTVASEEMGVATTTALGPIGLAIAAIGVAAFELYHHWDQVWGFIKGIVEDAWHFLEKYGEYIALAFGPTGLIVDGIIELYKHWDQVWKAVGDGLQWVWDHTLGPILSTIKTAISDVSDALDKVGGAINKVSGIAHSGGKLNPLNWFADGTNFAPGGMAVVGERGPELVNLPRGSQVIPNHKIGSAGGMTLHQTIYAQGTNADVGNAVARETAWKLRVGALAS